MSLVDTLKATPGYWRIGDHDVENIVDSMADALEREAARLAIIERNEDTLAFLKVAKWMRGNK